MLSNGSGSGVIGWDVIFYRASTGSGMNFFNSFLGGQMRYPGATTGAAGNLASGTSIGASGSWNTATTAVMFGSAAGNWQYGADNIVGFRFTDGNGVPNFYGWMRFRMGAQPASGNLVTRTVVDYGYESVVNTSILAGAVPAPGAVALLGVAGLVGARHRRS